MGWGRGRAWLPPGRAAPPGAPVHRLLLLMVPRFCWLLLRLALSLYSMKGLPVSTCVCGGGGGLGDGAGESRRGSPGGRGPSPRTCASRMANHSCCALIVLRARPSFS